MSTVVSNAEGRYGVTIPVKIKWIITLKPIISPKTMHARPIPEKIING